MRTAKLVRVGVLAMVAIFGMAGSTLACSYMADERPWKERIADEPLVFIGTVVEVTKDEATCKETASPRCVIFDVEMPVRGIDGDSYVAEQGDSADCRIPFSVGQRWLFAGTFIGGPSQFIGDVEAN